MTPYERWSLAASFGTLLVSVLAFGGLAWQLLMLSRTTRLDHDRRRKQATMEYLTATMDRRRQLREEGIPDERDQRAVSRLIARATAGDEAAAGLIAAYLTTYNSLGVGARSDAFDLQVIDQAWGGSIIATWEGYLPWIEGRRQVRGEPRLYEDLEWLAVHMTPRRIAVPRRAEGDPPLRGEPVPG
ncbi:DUF4760 domain-containing protein [Streptomyces radiopugnans]|uniref:DUF4760 domain-containing protein n=1 Tax=Streptomyces radiopugnans TaxID=403935 RepID=A0A1H9JLL9_9ACTN|nr:DUF4760 domain-containing protein [Streptomyces radiopugnans]SEQ87475.1 protein of unknown function [Streptomyces radiopugnans]